MQASGTGGRTEACLIKIENDLILDVLRRGRTGFDENGKKSRFALAASGGQLLAWGRAPTLDRDPRTSGPKRSKRSAGPRIKITGVFTK
jgi:hypothetical protein